MFTPAFAYNAIENLKYLGQVICGATALVSLLGLFYISYSIIWQNGFYTRRRKNMIKNAKR